MYSGTILYTVKCGSPGRLEEEGMVEEEGGRVEMVEEEGSILDTDLVSPVTQADIPDSGIWPDKTLLNHFFYFSSLKCVFM